MKGMPVLGKIVIAVLMVAAGTTAAGPGRPHYVFNYVANRGICARMPGEICTLYTILPGSESAMQHVRTPYSRRRRPQLPVRHAAPAVTPPPGFIDNAYTVQQLQGLYDVSALAIPSNLPPPSPAAVAPARVMILNYDHDPNAEADLANFRNEFGLSPCTIASGCLTLYNQSGGVENPNDPSTYPTVDALGGDGWNQRETMLDLEVVSAICPACRIALVEVDINSERPDNSELLSVAMPKFRTIGADVISLLHAWPEQDAADNDSSIASINIPIFASSGDAGYEDDHVAGPGVAYPAASSHVTAVGETNYYNGAPLADPSSGSGCSSIIPAPPWQSLAGICAGRAITDISAQGFWFPQYFVILSGELFEQ